MTIYELLIAVSAIQVAYGSFLGWLWTAHAHRHAAQESLPDRLMLAAQKAADIMFFCCQLDWRPLSHEERQRMVEVMGELDAFLNAPVRIHGGPS